MPDANDPVTRHASRVLVVVVVACLCVAAIAWTARFVAG